MTIGGLHKKVDLFFIFDIDNTINVCGLLSISFIDNFVASKAPGLLEKTRKTALSKMKMIPINFTDGEPVTCFGEKLELRIVSSDKDDVNVEDGYLIIYQRDINDIDFSERLMRQRVLVELNSKLFPEYIQDYKESLDYMISDIPSESFWNLKSQVLLKDTQYEGYDKKKAA